MTNTLLVKKVTFLCLALFLLWGANSTTQAQDSTHVQASPRPHAQASAPPQAKKVKYRIKMGATVFLIVPSFTLEPQWIINDRVGLGFRLATLLLVNHLALQADYFIPLGAHRRLSIGGSVGGGAIHFCVLSCSWELIPTAGARLSIEGKSRFSFGLGAVYSFLDEDAIFEELLYLPYAQVLWRLGKRE